MVLEYPMKMILYFVVVMVLIGIMWTFRDNISRICIFPPCNENKCEIKIDKPSNENSLTADIVGKYCNLCWGKSEEGQCPENGLCYAVSLETDVNPSSILLQNDVKEYCNIECNKNTKTVFFQYDSLIRKVKITC